MTYAGKLIERAQAAKTPDEARNRINLLVAQGWTVTTDTGSVVQLKRGKPVNHILHLLLSLVTVGAWVIVWILLVCFGGVETKTINIPPGTATP